ncbi:MAG: formamidopyrimidine-DNA glycosylase, partial [Acidobacteriota bacterium]|nr:formamidopyrimidine-DNA glycosylase [Acidobacteriota bacterium]
PRVLGHRLGRVRISTPFLLRTIAPAPSEAEGRLVTGLRRVGKRIAIGAEDDLWLVLHLMIAGRLHWNRKGGKALAAFEFDSGTLTLTEAGSKRRASLHVVRGDEGLAALDPGGIDPMSASPGEFRAALIRENHTVKRALTDPRVLSGIGNAYSDEILHAARMSPLLQTWKLKPEEWDRLYRATQSTLAEWIERLKPGAEFPGKVTAFRDDMAVHGRYGQPCPGCGEKVLRIRYADNETNYCARCQTGGRVLADRGLSRLLGSDWPRTLEDLENLKRH